MRKGDPSPPKDKKYLNYRRLADKVNIIGGGNIERMVLETGV